MRPGGRGGLHTGRRCAGAAAAAAGHAAGAGGGTQRCRGSAASRRDPEALPRSGWGVGSASVPRPPSSGVVCAASDDEAAAAGPSGHGAAADSPRPRKPQQSYKSGAPSPLRRGGGAWSPGGPASGGGGGFVLPPLPTPPALPTPLTLPPLDPRLDLWGSLLQASAAQLLSGATSALESLSAGALRVQRLTSAPPAGFPPGPSGDQTLTLINDPLPFLESATAQYGPVVGLLLGGERVAIVSGRAEARAVLIEQPDVFVKAGTAFFPGSSLAGNGLLVSDGEVWRRQRRLSNPAFRRAAVEAYAAAMVSAAQGLLDGAWASGGERDVYVDFNGLTLQITLDALFGVRVADAGSGGSGAQQREEDTAQIVSAVEAAFTFFTRRAASGFIIPEWLPTLENLEFAGAVQQLDRAVYGIINRRRGELAATHGSLEAAAAAAAASGPSGGGGGGGSSAASNGNGNGHVAAVAVPGDLLTSLLLSRDEDGSGMTDTALRDELMTLLIAGQETSAILLGWACALLAAHPDAQQRAYEEVAAVVGTTSPPKPASMRQLPFLEAVVLEALRLYSPAYMVGRCASRDTQLGGFSLPAGTTVLVAPYVMHRAPDVWPEPGEFRPERWAEVQAREGYQGYMSLMSNLGPNGAYLPFGGGPRNCVGTGFAMMEALLVLAAALQRYELALPADGSFPRPKPLLTLRPEAVRLRLLPRGRQTGQQQ